MKGKMVSLHNEGFSYKQIGEKLNISKTTAWNNVKKWRKQESFCEKLDEGDKKFI